MQSALEILARSDMSLGLAFLAGLVSLPHCAVMCGPILMVFSAHRVYYQGGRAAGYALVGGILGTLGAGMDRVGTFLSIQNLSIYVVVFTSVLFIFGSLRPGEGLSIFGRISRAARSTFPGRTGTFLAGMISALLPCGMLFPLWAYAASTGSAWFGAGAGVSFALGTIPGLAAGQWIIRRTSGRFFQAPALRWIAGGLLLAGAAWVFADRTLLSRRIAAGGAGDCHHPAALSSESP